VQLFQILGGLPFEIGQRINTALDIPYETSIRTRFALNWMRSEKAMRRKSQTFGEHLGVSSLIGGLGNGLRICR
jgi:hypothetical protein